MTAALEGKYARQGPAHQPAPAVNSSYAQNNQGSVRDVLKHAQEGPGLDVVIQLIWPATAVMKILNQAALTAWTMTVTG